MIHINSFREGSQGASSLVWSKNTQSWLCGDSEGSILSKAQNDEEHQVSKLEDEPILSIAIHPTRDECVVAENDTLCVRSLSSLDSRILDSLHRSNLPFTNLQFDNTGTFLFASSMEPDLPIISMQSNAVDQKLSTANLGVRTFSLSSDSKYIAVIDIDGSISIHSISYTTGVDGLRISQRDLVSINSNIISKEATRSAAEVGCKASWYPFPSEKTLLAVPSSKGSIVLLTPSSTSTADRKWDESFLLGSAEGGPSHHEHDVNLTQFSPNGKFLATADMSGAVLLWAFDTTTPSATTPLLSLTSITSPLHDLVWGQLSTDNYLIATTGKDWYQFPEVLPDSALPALLSDTATVRASDYLADTKKDDAMEVEEDEFDAMIRAAEKAEALYAAEHQQKISKSPVKSTATQSPVTAVQSPVKSPVKSNVTHSPVKSPVRSNAVKSPSVASPAQKKRLTKTNASAAAQEEDDDLLFDEEDSRPATKAVSFAHDENTTVADTTAAEATTTETTSIAAIKHKSGVTVHNKRLLDDEAEDMGDHDLDDDDADLDEEDNLIDHEHSGENGQMSLAEMLKIAKSGVATSASAVMQRKLQEPFQPSSTKFDEKRRRYLVWNKVGSIVLREETIENRIEIKFSNTAGSNRNETFPDRTGFTMAALAYEGAIFASDPEPIDEPVGGSRDPEMHKEMPGSTIYYHAFPGQKQLVGANESFRWTFSDGEAALAVATGCGWAAVATSRNLLYIFNSAGLPCTTVALSGPVVTLVGHQSLLSVVYCNHAQTADLYEVSFPAGCRCRRLAAGIILPTPMKKSIPEPAYAGAPVVATERNNEQYLEWAGFDVDNDLFVILDGQGIVWSLTNCAGWQWVPVLDTHAVRKSIEHIYWPVTVKFNKLTYVLLNGESKPAIFPQPVVATRSLRMPLPSLKDGKDVGDVHKDRMHSIVWGNALSVHTETVLQETNIDAAAGKVTLQDPVALEAKLAQLHWDADKAVLAALQDACQRQRIPLALSLTLQLRTERVIEAAIQVANHFGRSVVAEALDTILEQKRALTEELAAAAEQHQYQPESAVYSASEYAPEDENFISDNAHLFEHSPQADYNSIDKRVNFTTDTTESTSAHTGGLLSSRASGRPPSGMFSSSTLQKSQVVSPPFPGSLSASAEKAPARNPFAVVSSGTTPQKRKNVFEGIQDLKASPSPKKQTLNRQSSFSQQARQQRLHDKRIL